MEFINAWEKDGMVLSAYDTLSFIKILAPYAPFFFFYIYQEVLMKDSSSGNGEFTSIHVQSWPEYDESLMKEDTMTIVVQVNGRVRATIDGIFVSATEEDIAKQAKEAVAIQIDGKTIKNTVYVSGRLLNIVI